MKMKSLLFAALVAGMSFSAMAEEHYTNVGDKMTAADATVEAGTQYKNVIVTLERNASFANFSDNFTNIQFELVFPEGVKPILKSDGTVNIGKTTDCKYYDEDAEENVDAITWKAAVAGNVVTVVGANLNKHKLTKNPIELCKINYETAADIKAGEYVIQAQNIKYTVYNNDDFKTEAAQKVCTLKVEGGESGVNDINVNAVKTYKTIENGQVIIVKGDVKYNTMGQIVK